MSYWWQPTGLFNPLTMPVEKPLSFSELLSGPTGLAAFAPLIPLLRPLARRW